MLTSVSFLAGGCAGFWLGFLVAIISVIAQRHDNSKRGSMPKFSVPDTVSTK